MKTTLLVCFFLSLASISLGQVEVEIPAPPYIKTVQFRGDTPLSQLPLLRLGENLRISFDDIIGDEADYYYTIEHFNVDWTPSVLAKTEYMEGFDNIRIFNYTNSLATLQIYTHYELNIPNKNTRSLTKSGNYMLKIRNSDEEIVFSRKFMIYDPQVSVGVEILRTRDLKFIDEKQVVNFKVDSGEEPLINPEETVYPLLIQNNDLQNTIGGLIPQYYIGNVLQYRYDEQASFFAGNEFFAFENKDVRAATNRVQYIELIDLYHNYLYVDPTRADQVYTYNPDINGNFVIRTLQGTNPDTESEYAWIHFAVKHEQLPEGQEVYINGNFNNYVIEDAVKMDYNAEAGIYELPLLLKQGYYNYNYIVAAQGVQLPQNPISGDFWQTENEYDVLIYYRRPGGRFDELIGVGNALSTSISGVRKD
ncbi:DUF5103 domain-containing protein [Flavimarina sp. Hel_I_48]|uniref:type IX secretion system plug protein n=1 Tax=Flavimarina sp. Hel_I_48 TaxID=1392488 RepID=UPI0004DFA926|nr:DUF5103 domain-containing protein [Flavimarina sp. Hel_I_48]